MTVFGTAIRFAFEIGGQEFHVSDSAGIDKFLYLNYVRQKPRPEGFHKKKIFFARQINHQADLFPVYTERFLA